MHAARPTVCLLSLVATLLAAPAAAQTDVWTVTPFALFAGDTDYPGSGRSPGLGVAAAYRVSRHVSFEFEVSRISGATPEPGIFDSWAMTTLTANGIVMLPAFGIRPYAAVGAGAQRNAMALHVATDPIIRDDLIALGLAPAPERARSSWTEFVVTVGGGAQYAISPRVLARADVRRVLPRERVRDHWRVYGGMTFVVN